MAQKKMTKAQKEALVARLQAGRAAKTTKAKTTRKAAKTRSTKTARKTRAPNARATRVTQRSRFISRAPRRESTLENLLHDYDARDRAHRAKRALRGMKRTVWFPKAVIHSNKVHPREHHTIEDEIPEQALIEHWEAIAELKRKGVDIRHADWPIKVPHRLKEIELDAPVSVHARRFASKHGIVVKERHSRGRQAMERIFG